MLYIGTLVNTHGIKGEVKIISNFKYKEEVFKKDNTIYINDKKYTINTYRKHQKYDLITLKGYDNINDVLDLKGNKIYINKEEYTFSGILNEDLYGKKVTYIVYNVFQTNVNDTECYNRDTDGKMEITLSTCTDASNDQRIIVLAAAE